MFEYFERAWEIHVLPHPKAPGIAHVPPRIDGKRKSKTLCPVNNGRFPDHDSATGLACLTGQT